MPRVTTLHDNTRPLGYAPGGYDARPGADAPPPSQSLDSRIIAEAASRLVEVAGVKGWGFVAGLINDLSAYAHMGRGTGPLKHMELRLVVSCLAGDIDELRATHSEATAAGCTKQAHHLMMHQALDRIASRNPAVAQTLKQLRAINSCDE